MTTINEATVEVAALSWLSALGWQVAHGPGIAPDTPGAERNDYGQVVPGRLLRDALMPKLIPREFPVGKRNTLWRHKLSGLCPTLEILLKLGFEDRPPVTQVQPSLRWMVPSRLRSPLVSVCYQFAHLDLVACPETNTFGRYVVLLSGVVETRRELSFVEGEIPPDLGSALEAAAWVSYALKSDRRELEPLPDWFLEGERHWDLVPPARVELAARERQRAYEASPKCFIDRDYARPLRRNLLEEISGLAGETEMTFGFDGRALSIVLCGRVHEVIALGDSWPSSFQAVVSRETMLPARFMSSTVVVSVFEGYVRLDGLRLAPCEAVA